MYKNSFPEEPILPFCRMYTENKPSLIQFGCSDVLFTVNTRYYTIINSAGQVNKDWCQPIARYDYIHIKGPKSGLYDVATHADVHGCNTNVGTANYLCDPTLTDKLVRNYTYVRHNLYTIYSHYSCFLWPISSANEIMWDITCIFAQTQPLLVCHICQRHSP